MSNGNNCWGTESLKLKFLDGNTDRGVSCGDDSKILGNEGEVNLKQISVQEKELGQSKLNI